VRTYGSSVPYAEDWGFIPEVTGERPLTSSWLWEQNNEHRHPLTKLTIWAVLKVGRLDFRASPFFGAVVLTALAAAMILVARRVRGGTRYTDAFFPVAVLAVGFEEGPFYWVNCIFFLVPSALAAVALLTAALQGTRLTIPAQILAGAAVVLLPMCSAAGLLYLPALFSWLWYATLAGFWSRQNPRRYAGLGVMLAISALLALVIYFYFRGYESSLGSRPRPDPWDLIQNTLGFMAVGSPRSEPFSSFAIYVILALLLLSAAGLALAIVRGPAVTRSRALGLVFQLGGIGALALGMGYGRGEGARLYAILGFLAPCWFYLVWVVCGPSPVRKVVQAALFTWVVLGLPLSMQETLTRERERREKRLAFIHDLEDGLPPYQLLPRHKDALNPFWGDHRPLLEGMALLHKAQAGVFAGMRPDPPFREVPFPLERVSAHEITWERGTPPAWWPARPADTGDQTTWGQGVGHATGPESYLTVKLDQPTYVAAVRISSSHDAGIATNTYWRKSGESDFPPEPQFASPVYGYTATICIADTIDAIRFYPKSAAPFDVDLLEIVLLIPETGP